MKSPNEEDCDQQCIGGCHRGKDKLQCFACKNVMYEFSKNNNNHTKNCIDKCPEAFLLVSNFSFKFLKKYVCLHNVYVVLKIILVTLFE